jgi:hypothetical protein
VRLYDGSVWKQRPGVLEQDDAIAQQAPALLGVTGNHPSGLAIRRADGRARRRVLAQHLPPARTREAGKIADPGRPE